MRCIFYIYLLVAIGLSRVSAQEEEEPVDTSNYRRQSPRAVYVEPIKPPGHVYFWETFSDQSRFNERWISSKSVDDNSKLRYDGEYVLGTPIIGGGFKDDKGLLLKEPAMHYAIAAKLDKPFAFKDSTSFVVQYEANFQDTLTCGGGYVKLLASSDNLDQFYDKTPYVIMFGPDKCGQSSKIHFIIQFKNPITGEVEEKHCKQPTSSFDHVFTDKQTHLYTLVISDNDKYTISVDQLLVNSGNLKEDFTPSMIPPQKIDDPTDKKPSDWDDREKIPDPDAVKPEDWDEEAPMMIPDDSAVKPEGWLDDGPENIPDPDAVKPDDWEEDEDGTWEAPLIPNPICDDVGCGEWTPPLIKNPAYKGKWNPPMINNQNYMGVWSPKRIANPAYFELKDEETVYSHLQNIEAIGFELWSMSKDVLFDNVVITQDLTSAASFASQGYVKKVENERKELGLDRFHPWIEYFIELANERPYLWALYVVALVMPFVICAAICVRPKSSSRPPKDETSKKKKTDEPSPDDPPLEDPNATKSKDDVSFVAPEDDGDDKAETQEDKIEEIQENTEEIQEIVDELKKEEEEEEQFQATKPQRRGKRGPKRED